MGLFQREGDGYVAQLRTNEATVLHEVIVDVIALLSEGFDHSDPVIERLFPAMYRDDAEESEEIRRYTEKDLRSAKLEQAAMLLDSLPVRGGHVILDEEQADIWLRTLTDARLALGLRLGITDDTDLEAEIDDAVLRDPQARRVGHLTVYGFLTDLQGSLVEALSE